MATSIGARLQRKAARTDGSVASRHSFRRCYGTELTSSAILAWQEDRHVEPHDIASGKPVQNGFVESFSGRLRDECPNEQIFTCYRHAREIIEEWRIDHTRASTGSPQTNLQIGPDRTTTWTGLTYRRGRNGGRSLQTLIRP